MLPGANAAYGATADRAEKNQSEVDVDEHCTMCGLTLAIAVLQPAAAEQPPDLSGALRWRNIGPFRGGRVTAVAGIASQPLVYYMGATGGGVWKTDDAGLTWNNVSDGFFHTGSVGAVSVSQSNPNIVYVGM